MRRVVFPSAVALMLIGCVDTPSKPALDIQPQFDAVPIGTYATWTFTATLGEDGPFIEGYWTWTSTSGDYAPEPCITRIQIENEGEFTVGTTVYSFADDGNLNFKGGDCTTAPFMVLHSNEMPLYPLIRLNNASITGEETMLIPPAPTSYSSFEFTPDGGTRVAATLLTLTVAEPQTKENCLNDHWRVLGFDNVGMCMRYLRTGIDSRR